MHSYGLRASNSVLSSTVSGWFHFLENNTFVSGVKTVLLDDQEGLIWQVGDKPLAYMGLQEILARCQGT